VNEGALTHWRAVALKIKEKMFPEIYFILFDMHDSSQF
jgi:hypothetical protein